MGLGDKVKETLKDVFEPIVDMALWPIEKGVAWGIETVLDVLGKRMATPMTPLVKTLEDTGKVPPELQPLLDEIKNPKGEIASLLSFSAARGGLGMVSGGLLTTITSGLDYALKAIIQPSLLDPKSIIDVERRISGTEGFTNQEWLWTGFNSARRDFLREVTRPLLGLDTLITFYHRYPDQTDIIDNVLQAYGFTENDILVLKLTWTMIPGMQDIIRMAVREAFSPEIVQRFGTDEDFPEDFGIWAEKQGYSREWALNYWRAHWDLPSLSNGFEMLHRGIIDRAELDVLLRTQDVMPYWRQRLVEIAYRPLTRVDVRRMHALGTLTRDQVKRAYLDIGYNNYNAELMTQFTEDYNLSHERELTKTEILSLYKKGMFTFEESFAFLTDLGYDEETAGYLLEEETQAVAEEFRKLSLSQIKSLALSGTIDKGEATGRLALLGYSAEDIENIYRLWDLEAEPSIRLPSRTDLAKFWEAGIIDDDTWFDEMLKLGYSEEYIVWYYLEMSES